VTHATLQQRTARAEAATKIVGDAAALSLRPQATA
jgi:hypothetical protein